MNSSYRRKDAFHLIRPASTELSEPVQRVRDWIIEESKVAAMMRLP